MKNKIHNKLIKMFLVIIILTKILLIPNPALARDSQSFIPPAQKEESHPIRNGLIGVAVAGVITIGVVLVGLVSVLDDTGSRKCCR